MNQFALLLSFHPLAPPLQTYTRYLTFYYSTVYFIQTHNDICVLHGLNCFCTSIKKAEFVYFDYTPPPVYGYVPLGQSRLLSDFLKNHSCPSESIHYLAIHKNIHIYIYMYICISVYLSNSIYSLC